MSLDQVGDRAPARRGRGGRGDLLRCWRSATGGAADDQPRQPVGRDADRPRAAQGGERGRSTWCCRTPSASAAPTPRWCLRRAGVTDPERAGADDAALSRANALTLLILGAAWSLSSGVVTWAHAAEPIAGTGPLGPRRSSSSGRARRRALRERSSDTARGRGRALIRNEPLSSGSAARYTEARRRAGGRRVQLPAGASMEDILTRAERGRRNVLRQVVVPEGLTAGRWSSC